LPSQHHEWEYVLLDIDPRGEPDIVCDARELSQLPRSQFDAVYCSHNLEHYYQHDAVRILSRFLHVLKEDGFVHIRVPNIGELMRTVIRNKLDINDFLYKSPAEPITVRDVIYGYASSGNLKVLAYAFKNKPGEFASELLNLPLPE
jgi:predicted SAM-dependent methyltransferase